MKHFYAKVGIFLYLVLLPLIRVLIRNTNRVGVALLYDGKVVLVKNWLARDTWRLPGGGIGKDESPAHAAAREISEELGLNIEPEKLILVDSTTLQADKLGYKYQVFAYLLPTKPLMKKARFEITECKMFDSMPIETQKDSALVIEKLKAQRLL